MTTTQKLLNELGLPVRNAGLDPFRIIFEMKGCTWELKEDGHIVIEDHSGNSQQSSLTRNSNIPEISKFQRGRESLSGTNILKPELGDLIESGLISKEMHFVIMHAITAKLAGHLQEFLSMTTNQEGLDQCILLSYTKNDSTIEKSNGALPSFRDINNYLRRKETKYINKKGDPIEGGEWLKLKVQGNSTVAMSTDYDSQTKRIKITIFNGFFQDTGDEHGELEGGEKDEYSIGVGDSILELGKTLQKVDRLPQSPAGETKYGLAAFYVGACEGISKAVLGELLAEQPNYEHMEAMLDQLAEVQEEALTTLDDCTLSAHFPDAKEKEAVKKIVRQAKEKSQQDGNKESLISYVRKIDAFSYYPNIDKYILSITDLQTMLEDTQKSFPFASIAGELCCTHIVGQQLIDHVKDNIVALKDLEQSLGQGEEKAQAPDVQNLPSGKKGLLARLMGSLKGIGKGT